MIAIWPSRARESPPSRAIAAGDHTRTLLKTATRHSISRLCSALLPFFGPAAIAEPVLRVQAEGASGFFGLSVLENVERQGQGVAEQSTFSHHCVLFPMNL